MTGQSLPLSGFGSAEALLPAAPLTGKRDLPRAGATRPGSPCGAAVPGRNHSAKNLNCSSENGLAIAKQYGPFPQQLKTLELRATRRLLCVKPRASNCATPTRALPLH